MFYCVPFPGHAASSRKGFSSGFDFFLSGQGDLLVQRYQVDFERRKDTDADAPFYFAMFKKCTSHG